MILWKPIILKVYILLNVESLRYGQLSTMASDIARRTIGYTIQ